MTVLLYINSENFTQPRLTMKGQQCPSKNEIERDLRW